MWKRPWFGVALVLTAVFMLGIAMAILFNIPSKAKDDLWWSLSRAGVGIAITTVAGAVATGAFQLVDERRGRDQERRRVFREVVEAYNQVKATRRRMRALGLLNRSDPLLAEEAQELRSIMAMLSDAQLRFEAMAREVDQSDLFAQKDKDVVTTGLGEVVNYIRDSVLKKWEYHGARVQAKAYPSVLKDLELQGFIAHESRTFENIVCKPLDSLTEVLCEELFGKSRGPSGARSSDDSAVGSGPPSSRSAGG
jgi:hypothetical protein